MKRIFAVLMILVFMLSIGCGKQAAPAAPTEPSVQPPILTQVQPEAEEKEAPTVQANVSTPVEEKKNTTIGSRVTGTEETAVEEEVPEAQTEIKLLADKTMSESSMTVSKGTTLYWKNYDSWPHELAVNSGKGLDTKLLGKSERLLEGGVWQFTFNEEGTFVVRDTFSGKMRMNVTVQ